MKVTLKLFSNLMEYLPVEEGINTLEISCDAGTTPHQLIDLYKVPREQVRIMMLNGELLSDEEREQPMSKDDILAVWPLIQGG